MNLIIKSLSRWKEVILITIFFRVMLFLIGFFLNPDPLRDFWQIWVRWDGPHYIEIARNGYQISGEPALFIVFYPLYPLLIHFLSLLTQNFASSTVLISLFFAFVSAILLFELTLLDFNKRIAVLSVWFLNIFPLSYFLQASYTESLFLATSLATIYFFRQSKHLSSTIFGIFSTLTRVNGLLLIPLLITEWKFSKKGLLPILFTPIGFIIYLAINQYYFNNPFHFLIPLESNWFKKGALPWVGINNLIKSVPPISDPNFYIYFSEIIAIIFIFILSIYVLLKVRFSYGIYMLLNLILITSTSFILSTPRYSLTLFPIYIAFAAIKNRGLQIIISGIFIPILFYLTWVYTQGKWAY